MASAQLAAQFGLQLVRRDGKWDKVNPTARPENGQRLAGYVGLSEKCFSKNDAVVKRRMAASKSTSTVSRYRGLENREQRKGVLLITISRFAFDHWSSPSQRPSLPLE